MHTFVLKSATKLSSRLESLGRPTALVTLKIAEHNRLEKLPSRLGWFHALRTLERDDNPYLVNRQNPTSAGSVSSYS